MPGGAGRLVAACAIFAVAMGEVSCGRLLFCGGRLRVFAFLGRVLGGLGVAVRALV